MERPELSHPSDTTDSEIEAYSEHIHNLLRSFNEIQLTPRYLPLTKDNFFSSFQDGVLLGCLLHVIKPNSIALKNLNQNIDLTSVLDPAKKTASNESLNGGLDQTKSLYLVNTNLNYTIDSLKKAGFVVVNVGAEDFLHKKRDLILGIVWQLIRSHLLSEVNVVNHPELIRLLEQNESIPALIKLTPEQLLLRWFNYHLARAPAEFGTRQITNFSKDVQDGHLYLVLLSRIGFLDDSVVEMVTKALQQEPIPMERAQIILSAAEKLDARRFVSAKDIVNGNARLNLAFTATLFNKAIGIFLPSEEEMKALLKKENDLEVSVKSLTESLHAMTEKSAHHEETIVGLNLRLGSLQAEYDARVKELSCMLQEEKASNAAATSQLNATVDQLTAQKAGLQSTVTNALSAIVGMLSTSGFVSDKHKSAKLMGSHDTVDGDDDSEIADANALLDKLKSMVSDLISETKSQKMQNEVLATKLDQHMKLNNIIGEKIKQYSETVISDHKKAAPKVKA
jgi:hypothetical protein